RWILRPLVLNQRLVALAAERRTVVAHALRYEIVYQGEIAAVVHLIDHDGEQGLVLIGILGRRAAGGACQGHDGQPGRRDHGPHRAFSFLWMASPPERGRMAYRRLHHTGRLRRRFWASVTAS